jgi:hypothetical protein
MGCWSPPPLDTVPGGEVCARVLVHAGAPAVAASFSSVHGRVAHRQSTHPPEGVANAPHPLSMPRTPSRRPTLGWRRSWQARPHSCPSPSSAVSC